MLKAVLSPWHGQGAPGAINHACYKEDHEHGECTCLVNMSALSRAAAAGEPVDTLKVAEPVPSPMEGVPAVPEADEAGKAPRAEARSGSPSSASPGGADGEARDGPAVDHNYRTTELIDKESERVIAKMEEEMKRLEGMGLNEPHAEEVMSSTKQQQPRQERPSLFQRIDRYLSPPSKLIVEFSAAGYGEIQTKPPHKEHRIPRPADRGLNRASAAIGAAWTARQERTAAANAASIAAARMPKSAVLLLGSTSVEVHYQRIRHVLETARGMHGAEGLRAVGFEYRFVQCSEHVSTVKDDAERGNDGWEENNACDAPLLLAQSESLPLDHQGESRDNETLGDDFRGQRGRSQSDAGVEYGTSNTLLDVESSHRMIIVPSHVANAGDLVESAAIRERMVLGFNGREFRHMSSSAITLDTVDCDSDGEDAKEDEGEDEGSGGCRDNRTVKNEARAQSSQTLASTANNEVPVASSPTPVSKLPSSTDKGDDGAQSSDARIDANTSICTDCATRLFHIESDTMITSENLTRFIASGHMYDEIARLCQEHAQDVMKDEGSLVWVTICNDGTRGEPIRVLVDADHADCPGPVLLVVTGKGKVRAGIFSRQHLLISGIECSTALPMVREAKRREMKVAILDPNARGDREGMITFEASVRALFGDSSERGSSPLHHDSPMYVLAHSASGAQLVRYLMDQAHHLLPRIAAIAFTDSTHNIQWTKNNTSLLRMLESPACVYVRSANENRDDDWERHRPGDAVETDHHWQRRFGQIKTVWAGTKEHSLTNWVAHSHIWDHFDQHRLVDGGENEDGEDAISVSSRSSSDSHSLRLRARSYEVMTV